MNKSLKCPFRVGDEIRYTPTLHGLGHEAMTPPEIRLIPGTLYRISQIQEEVYVVVEGHEHPGGGLYWTEFSIAAKHEADSEDQSRSTHDSNTRNA